jgi:hypothetical protein
MLFIEIYNKQKIKKYKVIKYLKIKFNLFNMLNKSKIIKETNNFHILKQLNIK